MIKDNPDSWYVSFLQRTIIPQSVFYGYVIEWAEVTLGVLLLSSAVVLLSQPRRKGQPQYHLMLAYSSASILAALMGIFLTVNFHFLAGGWIFPWFNSSAADGEAIDLDAFLPPFEFVIILAQIALLTELTQTDWRQRFRYAGRILFLRGRLPSRTNESTM
ncbi:MAG TPA: hypothetical protein VFN35_03595 [Ktedonobacteraceae bacterium]|nr:hypothetical protein [Ktedonobacteraceae bacterium]